MNTVNSIQPRILYSHFPTQSELTSGIVSVNVQNLLYNVLESNEQLINIDLYIDIVYTGSVQTLKLSSGSLVSVNLQFKKSLNYNDI